MDKKIDNCSDCGKPMFVTFKNGNYYHGYMVSCDCVGMYRKLENRERSISKILDDE